MATALVSDGTFDSGWWSVFATSQPTEASAVLCLSATDHSTQSAYVKELHLAACGTSAGRIVLYDGSGGNAICGLPGCASWGGGLSIDLDFGRDTLKTLGGDNTQTLCISAAGPWSLFAKGYWGPKGFTGNM